MVLVPPVTDDFRMDSTGYFQKEWIRLLKEYDNKIGIKWTWQSLDSISIKSPLGGAMTGNNPTDRSKLGTKRHILTDKKGIPLSAVISSANTHDIKLVTDVVDNTVIKRPSSYKTKKTGRGKKKSTSMFRQSIQFRTRRTRTNQTRICIAHAHKRKEDKEKEEEEQKTKFTQIVKNILQKDGL